MIITLFSYLIHMVQVFSKKCILSKIEKLPYKHFHSCCCSNKEICHSFIYFIINKEYNGIDIKIVYNLDR